MGGEGRGRTWIVQQTEEREELDERKEMTGNKRGYRTGNGRR
jgi:hypothetical protein